MGTDPPKVAEHRVTVKEYAICGIMLNLFLKWGTADVLFHFNMGKQMLRVVPMMRCAMKNQKDIAVNRKRDVGVKLRA